LISHRPGEKAEDDRSPYSGIGSLGLIRLKDLPDFFQPGLNLRLGKKSYKIFNLRTLLFSFTDKAIIDLTSTLKDLASQSKGRRSWQRRASRLTSPLLIAILGLD